MSSILKGALAVAVIAVLNIAPAWAQESDVLEVQQQGNVSFVTGGIGKEESDALEAVQHSYNFRVLNADKTGHYSGDIHIVVTDSKYNIVLDTTSGPMLYANLPSGRYTVEGSSQGEVRKQTVNVTTKAPAHLRFVWPLDNNE